MKGGNDMSKAKFDLIANSEVANAPSYVQYRDKKVSSMLSTRSRQPYLHQTWADFIAAQGALGVSPMATSTVIASFNETKRELAKSAPWVNKAEGISLAEQISEIVDIKSINEGDLIKNLRSDLQKKAVGPLYALDSEPEGSKRTSASITKRLMLLRKYIEVLNEYAQKVAPDLERSSDAASVIFKVNPKTRTSFERMKRLTAQLDSEGENISPAIKNGRDGVPGTLRDINGKDVLDALNYTGGSLSASSSRSMALVGEYYEYLIADRLSRGLAAMEEFNNKQKNSVYNVSAVGSTGGKTDISVFINSLVGEFGKTMKSGARTEPIDLGISVKSGKNSASGTYVNTGTLNTFTELYPEMPERGKELVLYAMANLMSNPEYQSNKATNVMEFFSDNSFFKGEAAVYNNYLNRMLYGGFSNIMFQRVGQTSAPAHILITGDGVHTSQEVAENLFRFLNKSTGERVSKANEQSLATFALQLDGLSDMRDHISQAKYEKALEGVKRLKVAIKYRVTLHNFSAHSFPNLVN